MRLSSLISVRAAQTITIVAIALVAYFSVRLWLGEPSAHALSEYASRTGESCGTCHVSAGGGGPRTLRGLLWSARGRPDMVPELPGQLLAPGVQDGLVLYDVACAGCHGYDEAGLLAMGLAGRGISRAANRSFIVRGIRDLGMPAFDGQFTPEQLEALVRFVTEMGAGEGPPATYPLPGAELNCAAGPTRCDAE
jgi:mono/diheme cytochrome c family protein